MKPPATGIPALAKCIRHIFALFTLLLLIGACGLGSLPPQRSQDKIPLNKEPPVAIQEFPADSTLVAKTKEAPEGLEPQPAPVAEVKKELSVIDSEKPTLATLTEVVKAELMPAPARLSETVKVGLLLPLSGPLASEGAALLDAAQLALFDVADERFRLELRDTGGTSDGALGAAKNLLAGGAELLLGPLLSEEVRAITPVARVSGVNMVAFSTDTDVAGEGVYLLGHTSRQQVNRLVSFAVENGLSRFAVLAPSTPYGRNVAVQAREAVAAAGGEFIRVAFYAADASDAEDVVRGLADYDQRHNALIHQRNILSERDDEISARALSRLKGLDTLGDVGFDALLLPDGGKSLRQVVPLLPYYDIDPEKVRFLGTGLWDNSETLGEPTLIGGWYVGSPPEARASFVGRFQKVYGYTPNRISSLAYDATALAATLARVQDGGTFDAASIASTRGFFGTSGIFRFAPDGLPERGLAVLEISGRGEVVVISPPPERFLTSREN